MPKCNSVCTEREFPKRSCWSDMRCSICNKAILVGDDIVIDEVSTCPCCGSELTIAKPTHGMVYVKDFVAAIRNGLFDDDE